METSQLIKNVREEIEDLNEAIEAATVDQIEELIEERRERSAFLNELRSAV